jgi:hypothetical protein
MHQGEIMYCGQAVIMRACAHDREPWFVYVAEGHSAIAYGVWCMRGSLTVMLQVLVV